MNESWLLLETSGRVAQIGLVINGTVVGQRILDGGRRNNRELIPSIQAVLAEQNLSPSSLHGIMVSVGPGSFTGLRIGVMAAKTLAYATQCALIAVPTLAIFAELVPAEWQSVDVIADSLQNTVYMQRFGARESSGYRQVVTPLHILPLAEWLGQRPANSAITGPGAVVYQKQLAEVENRVVSKPEELSLFPMYLVGKRQAVLKGSEIFALEPLYLKGSSAEEKAKLQAKA